MLCVWLVGGYDCLCEVVVYVCVVVFCVVVVYVGCDVWWVCI